MRRLYPALLVSALLALPLGVAACGDDEADSGGGGDASFDLQVGHNAPQTGGLSAFGPAGEKAGDLAIQEAQKALEGTDITVEDMATEDSQTLPQPAQQAAEKMISDGATCMVGPWDSSSTVPVGRSVAARQQVPLISPSATSPELSELPDDGYVFRTAPSDALQGIVIADVVEEALGTDAVISVAARNDPYGEGIADSFTAAWEERGGTVTDSSPVLYDLELSSYNSEAQEIVADSPDGYVIIDFEEPYNAMGAALARTGDFDPTTMFTADGLAFEDGIPSSIPPDSLYSAQGTRPATASDSDAAKEFDKLFTSSSGEKKRNSFDAQTFDAAMLCVLAAVAAGSSEGPDIAEQIAEVSGPPGDQYDYTQLADAIEALQAGDDIDYEGVSGPTDLDENGDPTIGFYEIYSYDDKGAFTVEDSVEQEATE